MAHQTQLASTFNASSVIFGNLRKNKSGGKAVYLSNSNKNKLYLELPFMRAPFGLSTVVDEKTKNTSYSLDLSFDKNDENLLQLQETFKKLDETVIKLVAANSVEWLGKAYNVNVIEQALYKPLVRSGKAEYASTMKLKILMNDKGDFIPEAYNIARERVNLNTIEKGQKVKCIIDLNQIWFIDNKFGITARLQQVLLEPSKRLPSFAFQEMVPQAAPAAAAAPAAEDDEEEDEFVDED